MNPVPVLKKQKFTLVDVINPIFMVDSVDNLVYNPDFVAKNGACVYVDNVYNL